MIPAYWVALTLLMIFFRANPDEPVLGRHQDRRLAGRPRGVLVRAGVLPEVVLPRDHLARTRSTPRWSSTSSCPVYALLVRRWCRGLSLDEKLRRELYALAAVAAGSFAWRTIIEWRYEAMRRTCTDAQHARLACAATQWFPGYADYFAIGMAVAAIASWRLMRGEEPRWLQRIGAAPDLMWRHRARARSSGTAHCSGTHGLDYVPPVRNEMRHFLNGVIVLFLLLPGVFGEQSRGGVRRFLRWRPIAYTGLVSYGVYLWHQGFTDKAMHGPTATRCTRTSC